MSKKNRLKNSHQTANQFNYSGHEELYATEVGLRSYSSHIVREFSRKMQISMKQTPDWRVLEFGAGTGFLAELWQMFFKITPDCVEIDPELISIIQKKNLKCFSDIKDVTSKYNAVYTSNVLEHIEDDQTALRDIYDVMTPNGLVGIYVPALPILFSDMDRKVGHFRRYTKRELQRKVECAGFKVVSVRYIDSVGVLASFLIKILGFKGKANIGSVASLRIYDVYIFPISRLIDKIGFQHVVGKNLMLIAEKD
jgi:SAM-dependent methyltransferase